MNDFAKAIFESGEARSHELSEFVRFSDKLSTALELDFMQWLSAVLKMKKDVKLSLLTGVTFGGDVVSSVEQKQALNPFEIKGQLFLENPLQPDNLSFNLAKSLYIHTDEEVDLSAKKISGESVKIISTPQSNRRFASSGSLIV